MIILQDNLRGGSESHFRFANDDDKDCFVFESGKYIEECKKTIDLGLYQDHYFNQKDTSIFFKTINAIITYFFEEIE